MPPALVGKVTGLTRCVEERHPSNQVYRQVMLNARQGAFQSQALVGVQAICFGGHLQVSEGSDKGKEMENLRRRGLKR